MLIAPWMALRRSEEICVKNISQMHMTWTYFCPQEVWESKEEAIEQQRTHKKWKRLTSRADLELTLQVSMQPDPPTNTLPAASGTSAPSQAAIEFESALGNFGKKFLHCASRSCRMRLLDRTFCR